MCTQFKRKKKFEMPKSRCKKHLEQNNLFGN